MDIRTCDDEKRLRLTVCMLLCMTASLCATIGCDACVGVEGWVAEGDGAESKFVACTSMPPKPSRPLENVDVQLWTRNGRTRLDGVVLGPYLALVYVGPHERGMKYLLKAQKEGYLPLAQEVTLHRKATTYGTILLVPAKGPTNQGPAVHDADGGTPRPK